MLAVVVLTVGACGTGVPASDEVLGASPAPGYAFDPNLPYQAGAGSQTLDRYTPAGSAPVDGWPVIIYLHGGGFYSGDKASIGVDELPVVRGGGAILKQLDNGFVVLSVNYHLLAEGTTAPYVAAIRDAKSAVRWVATQSDLNASKVSISGSSAGGTLAMMVAATAGVAAFEPGGSGATTVKAAVSLDGPTDMHTFIDPTLSPGILKPSSTPTEHEQFGDNIEFKEIVPHAFGCAWQQYTVEPCVSMTSEVWLDVGSPIHYVSSSYAMPPLYLACGHTAAPAFPVNFGCPDHTAMATLVNSTYGSDRAWLDDTTLTPRPCSYASPPTTAMTSPSTAPCPGNHWDIDVRLNTAKLTQFFNTYGK